MPQRKPKDTSDSNRTGASELGLAAMNGVAAGLLEKSRHHPQARLAGIEERLEALASGLSENGLAKAVDDLRDLLQDIRKDTEDAANAILDACEAMETAADSNAAVADIYTACGFQDIVGQRCGKGMALLDYLVDGRKPGEAEAGRSAEAESGLLDGPAAGGTNPSQSEIDRLFSGAGDN